MDEGTTYIGLEVHKRTIAVAVRFPDGGVAERTIPHETRAVNRLVRKWKREAPGTIRCAYEAGPCGYGLQRDLEKQGVDCQVIAPSLIPRKPGERIKPFAIYAAPVKMRRKTRSGPGIGSASSCSDVALVGARRAGRWRTDSGFEGCDSDIPLTRPSSRRAASRSIRRRNASA